MNGMLFQAFGSLLLVIVLIYAVLLFLKKFVYRDYGTTFGNKNNAEFRIVGQIMLQPKKYIYVVKFFDRLLVISMTDNNMNLLSEITDTETLKNIESSFSPEKGNNKSFLDHLKSNLGIKR
jgi:flagellar biosynthetic protein FliO